MVETYLNSEKCQVCANCCKQWWFYTDMKDDALRASWLDTDKISVVKVKADLWKITFHIPCKMLIEKDGKFFCKQHKGERPDYCKVYPTNFNGELKEIIEFESKVCPIIKEVIKNG